MSERKITKKDLRNYVDSRYPEDVKRFGRGILASLPEGKRNSKEMIKSVLLTLPQDCGPEFGTDVVLYCLEYTEAVEAFSKVFNLSDDDESNEEFRN